MAKHKDKEDASGLRVDLEDVQGNILRGYRKERVRHLIVTVADRIGARSWIGAAAQPERTAAPVVTRGSDWGSVPPDVCFNIGVTYAGMKALGVPASARASFSQAYRDGAVARARTVGDYGNSAPEHWQSWLRDSDAVHLILTLHANTAEQIDDYQAAMLAAPGSEAVQVLGQNEGAWFAPDIVHFGYRDNISQPRFAEISPPGLHDDQPTAPLGTVLLGYPTAMQQLAWTLPNPAVLGVNGAFGAFRVLEQDVEAFEAYLDQAAELLLESAQADRLLPQPFDTGKHTAAERQAAMREVVAAKFAGRWRTGTPLALSPRDPSPEPPVSDTDFDYSDDPDGLNCPIGSHLRRANPRSAQIVQRVSNHTRRLIRRNTPYGPPYDPKNPERAERGLVGYFLCADLAAQFEAVQYDWINLGLQDPRLTGSNDPLLGDNDAEGSWFDVGTDTDAVRLRSFPRFVRTRGAAYIFLPSISALRWIGALS